MAMIINVPFHKQKKDYTCGPAVLKMIYGFFGKETRERNLVRELKTTKEGTNHDSIIFSARKNGFFCFVHDNASIEQIRHYISKNLPVIVNYIEPSNDEGHYAIVIGYTKRKLILNDPWNGKNFKIRIKRFTRRWHDSKSKHKKWMMVISRKEFNIGKQYNPIKKN